MELIIYIGNLNSNKIFDSNALNYLAEFVLNFWHTYEIHPITRTKTLRSEK